MIWFHFSYRNIPSTSSVSKPDFQILSLKVCRYKMIKSVKQLIFVSHLNFLSFWKAARAIKALGAHPLHFRDEKTVACKDRVASFKLRSQFIPEIPCLLFLLKWFSSVAFYPFFLDFYILSLFLGFCFLPTELVTDTVGKMWTIIQGEINMLPSLHSESLVSSFVCVKICPLYMRLLKSSGSVCFVCRELGTFIREES